MKVYSSISELVGHTPLVQLQRFAAARGLKANLLAKVEYFNPAGSVKDRRRSSRRLRFGPIHAMIPPI